MDSASGLELLGRARYVRLTTFRRDGTRVSVSVWVVRVGDTLLVTTGPRTGKVRRLRRNPRVLPAPSGLRGHVRAGAPQFEGSAEVFEEPERLIRLRSLLIHKYPLQVGLMLGIPARLRRPVNGSVGLRIRLR
jgi:PPOX class probable F420-dependent enzyme